MWNIDVLVGNYFLKCIKDDKIWFYIQLYYLLNKYSSMNLEGNHFPFDDVVEAHHDEESKL